MVPVSSEKYYWKGNTKSKSILFHGTKRKILFFLKFGNMFNPTVLTVF